MSEAESRSMWKAFEDGRTIGSAGSEAGVTVLDEEFEAGARITLEKGTTAAPFAITCGVYGSMIHTRFFADERVALSEYAEMKVDLAELTSGAMTPEEFVRLYP